MHKWFDRTRKKNTFEFRFWFMSTEGKMALKQENSNHRYYRKMYRIFHSSFISGWQTPLEMFCSLFSPTNAFKMQQGTKFDNKIAVSILWTKTHAHRTH